MSAYASIADIRAEGVPTPPAPGGISDASITAAIKRASAQIETFTGRWFEPRSMTLMLNGTGRGALMLGPPIVSVSQIQMIGTDPSSTTVDVALTDVRVYNRHLTGLIDPDDRDDPRIELLVVDARFESQPFAWESSFSLGRFPEGTQNIKVVGVFGFTEWDGGTTPQGVTPLLINRAVVLMVLKDLAPRFTSGDDGFDARNAWRLTGLRTRDQSIQYASPAGFGSAAIGAFTGDPEIDKMIAPFVRPPGMGAA